MRSWLQDPDGDGTYTFTTDQIPAGNYEFKVAHGLSWDENYGAGGAPGGANIAFTVPVRRRPDDDHLRPRRRTRSPSRRRGPGPLPT